MFPVFFRSWGPVFDVNICDEENEWPSIPERELVLAGRGNDSLNFDSSYPFRFEKST